MKLDLKKWIEKVTDSISTIAGNITNILDNLTIKTVTPTFTTSTGTLVSVAARKYGKMVTMYVSVKNSGTIANGSNIYVGTISSDFKPVINSYGCGFYAGRPLIVQLSTAGTLTVRNNGDSLSNTSDNKNIGITYLLP